MDHDASMNDFYKPRILVVDDEQRIRDACQMVLADQGFEVEVAPDGESGLYMIEAKPYDVILVDLMLPALSGLEVLSRVREMHQDTVVIVITGYATIEHSIEAMKNGAFDFIPKPFTPEQLRVVVSKAITHTRALADIAEARSRLRMMVNRLMDGVMTTDNQKRIVLGNPAFRHMIGFEGESVIGKKVEEVIQDKDLCSLIDEALAMSPDSQGEASRELSWGEDGDKVLNARCAPFKSRMGFNMGTITVLNDITAMKKMDQMKSDFVSMVSHEIRSPMNSLLMQLKVILDGLAGDVTEKQTEILERASGRIQSLIDLASELLDLARIESGLISQEKEKLSMLDLLKDQVEFHQAAAAEKNIQVKLESPPSLPPILANRQSMEEVASNLITNAIKYSPEGGNIQVTAGVENEYLRMDFADTGFGIDKEDQDKIFSRFYRVKDQNTRFIIGTGLGLPIVKSIIDAHHGRIRLKSSPGKGSTFTVHLPLSE